MGKLIENLFGNELAILGNVKGVSHIKLFETPIGYEIVINCDRRGEFPTLISHTNYSFIFEPFKDEFDEEWFEFVITSEIATGNFIIYENYNKDTMKLLLLRINILHPELT